MKARKIMSLLLTCSITAMLLAGCGKDVTGKDVTQSSQTEKTEEKVEQSSEDVVQESTGVTFPLEEPIEIDVFVCSGDISYMFEDTAIYKYMEEKTNVKLNVTNVSLDELEEKRNILINSGDYPDMFFKASVSNLAAQGSEGIIIPLDELMREYAPNYSALMDQWGGWGETAASDGHQYSFATIGKNSMTPYYFINQQWLDNLGLEMPTNADEFYNVLKAFKDQDADGDGDPNNEIPWIANADLLTVEMLLPYFGIQHQDYWSPFYLSDDKESIGFYANEDEYKEILRFMAKCYEEGLLYKEAFTVTMEQQAAMGQTGTAIGVFAHWGQAEQYGTYDKEKSDAENLCLQYTAMVPWEGGKNISYGGFGTGNLCITDKCEYPEIMVAWADLLYSEEGIMACMYGVEGDTYEIVDGQVKMKDESPTWGDKISKALIQMGGGTNHPTKTYSDQYTDYADKTENPLANYNLEKYNEFQKMDKVYNPFPNITMTEEEGNTFWGYWGDMNTYRLTYRAEVITGVKDLDSTWDEYVATLEKMHADEMLEIFNTAYDRYKANQ